MTLRRYTVMALAVSLGTLAMAWPVLAGRLEPAARVAALTGAGLAVANTVAAYGLARWSAGRSTVAFMRAVLGGMVARMGLMLAAVVVAVLGLKLPAVPLALALLGYFVLFLVIELVVLTRTRPEPAR